MTVPPPAAASPFSRSVSWGDVVQATHGIWANGQGVGQGAGQGVNPAHGSEILSQTFSSLTASSADATHGSLFFALDGTRARGLDFAPEALAKGVAGIVVEKGQGHLLRKRLTDHGLSDRFAPIPCLEVDNVRRALARTCPLFYPQAPAFKAAVTGTNGKTSVVHFTRALLASLGTPASSLGTLGLNVQGDGKNHKNPQWCADFKEGLGLTSPDPISLHRCFNTLAEHGIQHCALEASSHGLHQRRLDGTSFQTAVWTNFSRDHLDYHPSLDHYWEAKARLFSELVDPGARVILNARLPRIGELKALCAQRGLEVWTYGTDSGGECVVGRGIETDLKIVAVSPHGGDPKEPFQKGTCQNVTFQKVAFICRGKVVSATLPFAGLFQAENILAAMAIVHHAGYGFEEMADHLSTLPPVPGRLQWAGRTPSGGQVYVDYAHTPHALETALSHLRPHTAGKVWVVFGCGGERDQGKRPEMGRVAHTQADGIIVTDDNPRGEDPHTIRTQILEGCPGATVVPQRAQAIAHGVSMLGQGDTLLIAGKGHEGHQILRDRVDAFDDRHYVATLLASPSFSTSFFSPLSPPPTKDG